MLSRPKRSASYEMYEHLVGSAPGANAVQPTRRRLLDRDRGDFQSMGRYSVRRKGGSRWMLYYLDVYHTVINAPTWRVVAILCALFTSNFVLFAVIYNMLDAECMTNVNSFVDALYFSLETVMTIGYGVEDPFFNGCLSTLVVIATQCMSGLLLQALAVGVFFQRIARAQSRANTIIFSRFAVVQQINGAWYVMFQVCERRKHQLIEAHVRCYAVVDEPLSDGRTLRFQTRAMRLQRPDDQLGSLVLLALPTTVVHRIDAWSPLHPRVGTADNTLALPHLPLDVQPMLRYAFPQPLQRASDSEAGGRDCFPCPVCGETYATLQQLQRHASYVGNREEPMVAATADSAAAAASAASAAAAAATAAATAAAAGAGPGAAGQATDEAKEDAFASSAQLRRLLPGQRSQRSQATAPATAIPTAGAPLAPAVLSASRLEPVMEEQEQPQSQPQPQPQPQSQQLLQPQPQTQPQQLHSQLSGIRGGYIAEPNAALASARLSHATLAQALQGRTTAAGDDFTEEQLRDHLQHCNVEVLAFIEGIDAPTSGTVQARHSFTMADMVFGHEFEECVRVDASGRAEVDFDAIHRVRPVERAPHMHTSSRSHA